MKNQYSFKVCIYDPDLKYAEFIKYVIELNPCFQAYTSDNINSFELLLDTIKPDAVTIELNKKFEENDKMFETIKTKSRSAKIIIVSSAKDTSLIFQAVKFGILSFIEKNEETKSKLIQSLNQLTASDEITIKTIFPSYNRIKSSDFSKIIIGKSLAIRQLDELIEKASATSINVLVTGETGTGKELIAKCIHENSIRKKSPLITVNMAAIPSELLESELMGHEKGSFTGASTLRIGKFESAGDGTIFLDEIGEMDYNLQAKILRVLQEREIVRVGGSKTIKVNCRLITATNRNLSEEITSGKFREDLYYRLYGLCIHLPPLRDRGNDKILLAEHLIDNFCKENQINKVELSPEAKNKLLNYSFPGNIRELKSCIELAIVMSNGKQITSEDIRIENHLNFKKMIQEEKTLEEYQKEIVKHYLDRYDKNVVKVANKLAVGKSTLYRMLKEHHEYFDQKK